MEIGFDALLIGSRQIRFNISHQAKGVWAEAFLLSETPFNGVSQSAVLAEDFTQGFLSFSADEIIEINDI